MPGTVLSPLHKFPSLSVHSTQLPVAQTDLHLRKLRRGKVKPLPTVKGQANLDLNSGRRTPQTSQETTSGRDVFPFPLNSNKLLPVAPAKQPGGLSLSQPFSHHQQVQLA